MRPPPTAAPPPVDAGAPPGPSPRGPASPATRRRPSWGVLATLMLLAAGVALRLVEYTSGRALWLDESLLWLNLRGLSFRELTGPLDLGQGAPIPFLLVEKSALEVLGDAEWALRLPSLVAGIALLPVVALLAARLLTPGRAWVALAPVALGVPAIAYSSEVKQYGIDALVAGLLLLVLLPAARAPLTRGRAAGLALAGAAAVWCSDPAVFVLAGGGVALLVAAAVARDRARLTALGWVVAAWLASFAVLYVVHVRDLAVVRGLATSDSSGGSGSALREVVVGTGRSMEYGVGHGLLIPAFTPVIVLGGLAVLWWTGRRVEAGILGLPVAVFALAGLLGQYPVYGRTTMFLAPGLSLAFGAGVLAVWDAARARGRPLAAAAAIAGAACALPWVLHLSDTSPASEEIDSVTTALAREIAPGDAIYLSNTAQYAYAYYGTDPRIRFRELPTRGPGSERPPGQPASYASVLATSAGRVVGLWGPGEAARVADVDRMKGVPRFWMIFSHASDDEVDASVRRAGTFARPVRLIRADGAFAVLMERRP